MIGNAVNYFPVTFPLTLSYMRHQVAPQSKEFPEGSDNLKRRIQTPSSASGNHWLRGTEVSTLPSSLNP